MSGQLNFEELKESFFMALDTEFEKHPTIASHVKEIFNQAESKAESKAEFQNQSDFDSRCKKCGTKFNASDFIQCPDCGSRNIERNF